MLLKSPEDLSRAGRISCCSGVTYTLVIAAKDELVEISKIADRE